MSRAYGKIQPDWEKAARVKRMTQFTWIFVFAELFTGQLSSQPSKVSDLLREGFIGTAPGGYY